jgi:DcuC family C4-dicarboxylate transporter
VPRGWLVDRPDNPDDLLRFDSRLIGAAMLVGVTVAATVAGRAAWGVAGAFFEGAGYAFANIISIIVAAACFGEGVKRVGLAKPIGDLIAAEPNLLLPLAGALSLGFALLCGSGMATTQTLFGFFADSALRLGVDPAHVGAVVSLAAAAGRTMSPVAAVTLMCAALTRTDPVDLFKRVAGPLVLGVLAVVVAAMALPRF